MEWVRDHVLATTAVLSTIALALVFGAALQAIPPALLPAADDAVLATIPSVNAGISVLAILTIGSGWLAIRRNDVIRHRRLMIASTVLFATFLALYLYRVSILGPTPFPGPERVYLYGYLPLLAVHVMLAIACVPLVVYTLVIGLSHRVREIPHTRHPQVGRIAASLWLISFTLGICVYVLLHVVY